MVAGALLVAAPENKPAPVCDVNGLLTGKNYNYKYRKLLHTSTVLFYTEMLELYDLERILRIFHLAGSNYVSDIIYM